MRLLYTQSMIVLFLLGSIANASGEAGLGVYADSSSFKEIFEANLTRSKADLIENRPTSRMELSASSLQLEDFQLANAYYSVAYSDQVRTVPMLRFYVGNDLLTRSNLNVESYLSVGFAYREEIMEATGVRGGVYKDVLKLQWAPLQIGLKLGCKLSHGILAFARTGVSYEWISVAGTLDGINQSYWAPSYQGSGGFSLFTPNSSDLNTWFGGIPISLGVSKPLRDDGKGLAYTQVELGVIFNL